MGVGISLSVSQWQLAEETLAGGTPWGVFCMICNVPPTLDHWEARCTHITSRPQGSSDRIA